MEITIKWPVERTFKVKDVPDYETAGLRYFTNFLKMSEWLDSILSAYKIASYEGATFFAKLTPRWLGLTNAEFTYRRTGEPQTYAEFKVPDGVFILLLGFVSVEHSIEEIIMDILPECNILAPVFPDAGDKYGYEGATLFKTLPTLLAPGDEVRIQFVMYDDEYLYDFIRPFGVVFYNAGGLNEGYLKQNGSDSHA